MSATSKKRLTLSVVGEKPRYWKYFHHFFFLPAIATFSENIYGLQRKWYFQRVFSLYIFFWEFSINWKYGRTNEKGD